jgi:serine/threonine protein kinase
MDCTDLFNEEYLNKLYFPGIDDPVLFNQDDFQELETLDESRHTVKSFFHKQFEKKIAIKSITIPYKLKDANERGKKLLNLKREVENFKKLGNVENIVTFYGICIVEDRAWICMELMDLSLINLYQMFHQSSTSKRNHFPEVILGAIIVKIVDALIYCKSKNIMHRDIKPHNILLNNEGQIKLCDFGESRILDSKCSGLKSVPLRSTKKF